MSRKSQFSLDISKWINESKQDINIVTKAAALKLFSDIVYDTPVDTGHLAYNWQASVNSPPSGTREGTDKDKSGTISQIESEVNKYDYSKNNQIWLTNNIEYAMKIEYGDSRIKAPKGMVRINIRRWNDTVKKAQAKR